jgi:hypothetical protein
MPEYSFKDHAGNEFIIDGELVNKVAVKIGTGPLSEHGPECHIVIYKTQNRGYLATIEYGPGIGNQKRGDYWACIKPDLSAPKTETLNGLKSGLETALHLAEFPHVGVEHGVKEAIKQLFPTPGPTKID